MPHLGWNISNSVRNLQQDGQRVGWKSEGCRVRMKVKAKKLRLSETRNIHTLSLLRAHHMILNQYFMLSFFSPVHSTDSGGAVLIMTTCTNANNELDVL